MNICRAAAISLREWNSHMQWTACNIVLQTCLWLSTFSDVKSNKQPRKLEKTMEHSLLVSAYLISAVESCTRTATSGDSSVPNSFSTPLGPRTALDL